MIIANNRLKKVIDKIDFAAKNNRMMLTDKLDAETLATIYAEIEARNSKIKRLEKMAGITETERRKSLAFWQLSTKVFLFLKNEMIRGFLHEKKRTRLIKSVEQKKNRDSTSDSFAFTY